MLSKEALRKQFKSKKNTYIKESKKNSAAIVDALLLSPILDQCQHIAAYIPIDHEIDIIPLLTTYLEKGKSIYLPKYNTKKEDYDYAQIDNLSDLEKGKYQIKEPKTSSLFNKDQIQAALIPALFFDKNGNRLGHGNGYFDRLLCNFKGVKIGLCLHSQLSKDYIPVNPRDIKMDYIVTQEQTYTIF